MRYISRAEPPIGISLGCQSAYRRGQYLRPAKIPSDLADRMVQATPSGVPRNFLKELLLVNGNHPTWVNHGLTSIINHALRSCDGDGKHFRLGRNGVHARVWEVSLFQESDPALLQKISGRPSMHFFPEVTQQAGLSR